MLRAYPTLILAVIALLSSTDAWATRMVKYSATGQNYYGGKAKSDTSSSCVITIMNLGPTPQVVTFTSHLVATSTPSLAAFNVDATYSHTITLGSASAPTSTANCTNGASACTFPNMNPFTDIYSTLPTNSSDFPTIRNVTAGTTAYTQDVFCEGSISVDDSVAGTPGFITASGTLTTYRESTQGVSLSGGLGTSKTVTNTPSNTAIIIGEGRAF